jgi:hypothetical protein
MSNNGVINGITELPSCSRSVYIVYATRAYEASIIGDLMTKKPETIISSTSFWSYAIDGHPMHLRFPELNEFILKNYPVEECKFDYCVRYIHK